MNLESPLRDVVAGFTVFILAVILGWIGLVMPLWIVVHALLGAS